MGRGRAETHPGYLKLHLPIAGCGLGFRGWLLPIVCAIGLAVVAKPAPAAAVVHSYIVVDADTGQVLEAYNADRQTYPASLTKLMTLYLTFDALEHGRLRFDEPLYVSPHAAAASPIKLGLRPGSTITVRQAILGIVTESANDAAIVLGEKLGHGSDARFAQMMNAEARRLGMTRTEFRNASGLPNPYQKTTARDIATLATAIIHTFPQYYHFFSVRYFYFHGTRINSDDHLLGSFRGCDGMKTGFIRASGYNLVSSAIRNGHRLVGVVMGGRTIVSRDVHMERLLDVGFARVNHELRTEMASRRKPEVVAQADRPVYRHDAHDVAVRRAPRPAEVHTVVARREVPEPAVHRNVQRLRAFKLAEARESGDYSIRIGGVFSSARFAREIVQSAIRTAPHELKGARFELVSAERHGRHGYAIRVVELSPWMANRACRTLRDRQFDCKIRPPRAITASAR